MSQNIALLPDYEDKINDLITTALQLKFGKVGCVIDASQKPQFEDNKIIVSVSVQFLQSESNGIINTLFQKGVPIDVIIQIGKNGKLSIYSINMCIEKVTSGQSVTLEYSIGSQSGLTDRERNCYIQKGGIKIPKTGYYDPESK